MGKSNMAKRTPPTRPFHARRIEALGQRLRTARLARGMTQSHLAERVGVDRTTIGKLESGDPATSLSTVLRVLSALGLDHDIDQIAATDPVGTQLAASQLKRPSSRPAARSQSAASISQHATQPHSVAEPPPDRYALRASQKPPPMGGGPVPTPRSRGAR